MKKIRCAIYTRKSSEEGLDMEFNSFDAQREAAEAYIKSQRHEGWELIPKQYNDGGFSGGNMERPAFKELLQDIKADKIDIVVVYKVDRLTRSLMDFAKIIEVFDAHNASFVSITQQFNTTTSMGRLTLNMLLSFAQFEREITSERLRDKFEATRQKGMYVGGNPAVGYKREGDYIVFDPEQVDKIRQFFYKYLEFRSINKLHSYLKENEIYTKTGKVFSKGNLYNLLKNKIYIGKIVHNNKVYDGIHEPLIDIEIFNKVQEQLAINTKEREFEKNTHSHALLRSKLFDDNGNYMSPSYSNSKTRRYRYYLSQALIQNNPEKAGTINKVSAGEIENVVRKTMKEFLCDKQKILSLIAGMRLKEQKKVLEALENIDFNDRFIRICLQKVILYENKVEIFVNLKAVVKILGIIVFEEPFIVDVDEESIECITLDARIVAAPRRCNKLLIGDESIYNVTLIQALTKGLYYHKLWEEKKLTRAQKQNSYVRRLMSLRYLPPKLIEDILNGKQSPSLTIEQSIDMAKYRNL